jgi:hypothetical protein
MVKCGLQDEDWADWLRWRLGVERRCHTSYDDCMQTYIHNSADSTWKGTSLRWARPCLSSWCSSTTLITEISVFVSFQRALWSWLEVLVAVGVCHIASNDRLIVINVVKEAVVACLRYPSICTGELRKTMKNCQHSCYFSSYSTRISNVWRGWVIPRLPTHTQSLYRLSYAGSLNS